MPKTSSNLAYFKCWPLHQDLSVNCLMDTDKIFFNGLDGKGFLRKNFYLVKWTLLACKRQQHFCKNIYGKYSIRSRPCIIQNPNFSRLVLKLLHKLWISFNEFSKVRKCTGVYKIPCLQYMYHFQMDIWTLMYIKMPCNNI